MENINWTGLMEILDNARLNRKEIVIDEEFKNYNFMNKSEIEIKEKIIEIIDNF